MHGVAQPIIDQSDHRILMRVRSLIHHLTPPHTSSCTIVSSLAPLFPLLLPLKNGRTVPILLLVIHCRKLSYLIVLLYMPITFTCYHSKKIGSILAHLRE